MGVKIEPEAEWLARYAVSLSEKELTDALMEVFGWRRTGMYRGSILKRIATDFGESSLEEMPNYEDCMKAAKEAVLLESARRFYNERCAVYPSIPSIAKEG